jgi:hypothetical protein
MPLESWKVVFEVGGIVLLALTFVFGAGAWLVNNRLSLLQSRELEDFKLKSQEEQQKTAAAQAEAAKAQLELRRYIDHVDRKAGPRRLDREKFLEQLNGKPIGLAVIRYKPEDTEAFNFATAIGANLSTAGWTVMGPQPFPSFRQNRPSEFVHGGAFGSGVTIRCKNPPKEAFGDNTAAGALIDALMMGCENLSSGFEVGADPFLKENEVHIIIGQKK